MSVLFEKNHIVIRFHQNQIRIASHIDVIVGKSAEVGKHRNFILPTAVRPPNRQRGRIVPRRMVDTSGIDREISDDRLIIELAEYCMVLIAVFRHDLSRHVTMRRNGDILFREDAHGIIADVIGMRMGHDNRLDPGSEFMDLREDAATLPLAPRRKIDEDCRTGGPDQGRVAAASRT